MISELHKFEFYKCKGLLHEQGQIEAKAVIEGINPGRVFVDDIGSPTAGLIWLGNNDGFFFIGNENNDEFNNELNYFIDKVIMPEAKKVSLDYFEGIGDHQKWDLTIKKLFEHRKLESWKQRVYLLQKEDYRSNYESDIEQGYEVVKICNNFLENRENSIKNIEFLHSKIMEFWSSIENFLNDGIGYCIVYESEIVSICFSGFVVGNVHCIGIETFEEHRGKKLAKKLAHRFVKDCLENDSVPYWDCMESNKPSIAVAENIGFKNVSNYKGYYFPFE
ncbi:GNAT family N-acetyltransferase [Oceanobacillus chungangensis]|uniref:GNAT family N-acetyltransferase n=1 Tax=Oceanobacillus chungangensis TaxID=1229152 RepID=A0A3D8PNP3_9BACI|nr:GNAT family N-acetyltransferase [Oceanobacillus chungangensis]RDW17282.1 GNAT family N-acetyltransferase [Oceanobacillus chungangensis]